MAKSKQNIYVIQKFVKAGSLADALKKERKAELVNVTLTIAAPNQQMIEAVGFRLQPDNKEEIDYK